VANYVDYLATHNRKGNVRRRQYMVSGITYLADGTVGIHKPRAYQSREAAEVYIRSFTGMTIIGPDTYHSVETNTTMLVTERNVAG